MSKTISPLTGIIGILIAIGLFFTYVRPTFEEIKGIQNETAQYAQAVEKASELQRRITELKQKQSSIALSDLERLEALLPDRVDEVAVLMDIDGLATKHQLKLGDIKVGEEGGTAGTEDLQQQSSAGRMSESEDLLAEEGFDEETSVKSQYSALDIGFSVTGTYESFRPFLQDVERSLVLMEVTKVTFGEESDTATGGNEMTFTVNVRLYSLKPPTS